MMTGRYNQMNLWERTADRLARAKQIRQPFEAARNLIVEYFRPDLTEMVNDVGKVFTSARVYNGDPAYCGRVMTQGIMAGMANAAQPWRAFKAGESELRDDNDIRAWLQQLDEIMLDAYAARESGFYRALSRYLHAKFTIGSPVMIIEEHNGRIVYTSPHHQQYWLVRDYFGEVRGLHLVYQRGAMEIADDFAGAEHLFPLTLQNALRTGGHFQPFEMLQSFFPADDRIFRDRPAGDVEIMRHRPWVCTWQLTHTDLDKQEPLQIRYYGRYQAGSRKPSSRPFVVGDWDLNPNETYARTPAWHSMMDVKGGQEVWKSQIQLAELKSRPPIWTLQRLAGHLKRRPGDVTEVTDKEYQSKPVPFGHEGDYLTAQDMWERISRNCERWFFVDYFRQYTQMIQNQQTPPTATQIIDMDAEKLTQLSGGIQGIETDDLWPIDDRVFEILSRLHQIPPPPERFMYESDGELIPQFQGPLSQAQRLNTMLRRVQTGMQVCTPLFALDQQAILKLKVPELVEHILEEVGIWEDTIRDKDEYETIIQGIIEQQQRQQAIAEGKAQADTLKQLSGKTEPSSPLVQLMRQ